MPIEHIRLSQAAKEQLITLKRRTGIKHWNVLCRWGFCLSLREPSKPPKAKIPSDSNVEMSWRVFAGTNHEVYEALLMERCLRDRLEIDDESIALQFRLHLHRGIAYLAGNKDLKNIDDLIGLTMSQ